MCCMWGTLQEIVFRVDLVLRMKGIRTRNASMKNSKSALRRWMRLERPRGVRGAIEPAITELGLFILYISRSLEMNSYEGF